MKTCLIALLSLTITSTSLASGSRSLNLDLNSLATLPEIELSQLRAQLHYLGSTEQWHVLAETLSSVSEGMPYDNTYGYKVNVNSLTINNGWILNLNDTDYYWDYVADCPIMYLNKEGTSAQIAITHDRENACITHSEKRELK